MEINTSARYECPECHASRGLAFYNNEVGPISGYCWSCQTFFKNPLGDEKLVVTEKQKARHDGIIKTIKEEYPITAIRDRGISEKTSRYFGIRVGFSEQNGKDIEYHYYPREKDNKLIGWHVKTLNPKGFYNLWSTQEEHEDGTFSRHKEANMFGTTRARKIGGYKLIVVEGPTDMATSHEMILNFRSGTKHEGQIVPIVSPPDGCSSVVKSLSNQRDFVESFKEVVLCLDQDEPGMEATRKACALMKSWEVDVKVAHISENDPGDMFKEGKADEFCRAVLYNAKAPRPTGAVESSKLIEMALERPKMGIELPWPTLTKKIFGIQPGKIISVGAGGGVGKSSWSTELLHGLIEGGHKPGIFYFEEDPGSTMKMIASRYLGKNLLDPNTTWSEEEAIPVFHKIDNSLQVADVDVREWGDIKELIMQWVLADNLTPIILDPITKILPPSATEAYELLNRVYDDCGNIALQYGASFVITSHLRAPEKGAKHEAGGRVYEAQFTGSRSILRWSHTMLGLERDKQADGEEKKGVDPMLSDPNIMCARVLKNRSGGWTGPVYLEYNVQDRSLKEI